MNTGTEILLSALIVIGAVFTFVGSLSLLRFKDFYTRLHGPTKASTLGVGCLLIASSVYFSSTGEGLSLHEILVSVFLFITAPISAHLLAKAALHLALPSSVHLPDDKPALPDLPATPETPQPRTPPAAPWPVRPSHH